jgi:ribonuclease BN (tRNA processing enzyme)
VKLTILGSGTGIIKKDRMAPGYLLELNSKESFLLDCGGTTVQQFAKINFDYTKIDHILISHPHADHLGGFISLIFAIKLESMFSKVSVKHKLREKTLYIHGYPGFLEDYKLLRRIMSGEADENYPIKVFEHKNQKIKYPKFILETKIVGHAEKLFTSIAFRLETDKKVFVYSGDSRYCDALIKLARGADLFLCDSSSMEKGLGTGYHLTPEGAGKIAQEAGVKKLVLTHFYDVMPQNQVLKNAKKYFSGKIILAKDLMKIKI